MQIWKSILAIALSVGSLSAGTLWAESGPYNYTGVGSQEVVYGWSLSTTYTGVTISFHLLDDSLGGPIAGTEGTAYLMNQIGPGATAANEVVAPDAISGLTNSDQNVTLFSGLTLGPGNYYVVLATAHLLPSPTTASLGIDSSNSLTATTGPGVTILGVSGSGDVSADSFPPDVGFTLHSPVGSQGAIFSIAATQGSTTPEPGTAVLLAGAAFVLAAWRRKRRC